MALLDCVPQVDGALRELKSIDGQPPNLAALPEGCRFEPRCERRIDRCRRYPDEERFDGDHRVSCWRAVESPSLRVAPPFGSQRGTRP